VLAQQICPTCHGQGQKSNKIKKSIKQAYQQQVQQHQQMGGLGPAPTPPVASKILCVACAGSGLQAGPAPEAQPHYPHVAIVGAGLGGMALALACWHRGIPFSLYERDHSFEQRAQGYGLTLQQASKVVRALGIPELAGGLLSTRHVVHNPQGQIVGEWGQRQWLEHLPEKSLTKRYNVHIARQALRKQLWQALADQPVHWDHQFMGFSKDNNVLSLRFEHQGQLIEKKADLLIGADGIRSTVRQQLLGPEASPLRYLGCMVILGICPLTKVAHLQSDLLDSATVFQTANAHERMYMMPYSPEAVMWQFSFPIDEAAAKTLAQKGPEALKQEALQRAQWHCPIPEIVAASPEAQISGYPVYDRALLQPEDLPDLPVSLIGDAAHPMSPFKGQGANQALLDALALARQIYQQANAFSDWRSRGLRTAVLNDFEAKMLDRSGSKVLDSADAASFLHSPAALQASNQPRRRMKEE
jgi:salicylate hydroxylase